MIYRLFMHNPKLSMDYSWKNLRSRRSTDTYCWCFGGDCGDICCKFRGYFSDMCWTFVGDRWESSGWLGGASRVIKGHLRKDVWWHADHCFDICWVDLGSTQESFWIIFRISLIFRDPRDVTWGSSLGVAIDVTSRFFYKRLTLRTTSNDMSHYVWSTASPPLRSDAGVGISMLRGNPSLSAN